jgi:hypothetical protein
MDITQGMPQQGVDDVHPDLDTHEVQRAKPDDEVA